MAGTSPPRCAVLSARRRGRGAGGAPRTIVLLCFDGSSRTRWIFRERWDVPRRPALPDTQPRAAMPHRLCCFGSSRRTRWASTGRWDVPRRSGFAGRTAEGGYAPRCRPGDGVGSLTGAAKIGQSTTPLYRGAARTCRHAGPSPRSGGITRELQTTHYKLQTPAYAFSVTLYFRRRPRARRIWASRAGMAVKNRVMGDQRPLDELYRVQPYLPALRTRRAHRHVNHDHHDQRDDARHEDPVRCGDEPGRDVVLREWLEVQTDPGR